MPVPAFAQKGQNPMGKEDVPVTGRFSGSQKRAETTAREQRRGVWISQERVVFSQGRKTEDPPRLPCSLRLWALFRTNANLSQPAAACCVHDCFTVFGAGPAQFFQ